MNELMECFKDCKIGIVLDVATPLVGNLVPRWIKKFSEQNEYMQNNFSKLFVQEYGFKAIFKVNEETSEVVIEMIEDSYYLDGFVSIMPNIKKIKERLRGFKVKIEMNIIIDLNY